MNSNMKSTYVAGIVLLVLLPVFIQGKAVGLGEKKRVMRSFTGVSTPEECNDVLKNCKEMLLTKDDITDVHQCIYKAILCSYAYGSDRGSPSVF
ncbi:uncharacterized protein LOC143239078 isoform X2 [Tachypleus tridentatus]